MPRTVNSAKDPTSLEPGGGDQDLASRGDRQTITAWWNRPCGAAEVLAIATPLVMSTISWTLINSSIAPS